MTQTRFPPPPPQQRPSLKRGRKEALSRKKATYCPLTPCCEPGAPTPTDTHVPNVSPGVLGGETEAQGAKGLRLCLMQTVHLLDADGEWPSPHLSNCHSSRDKGKHNTASWPPEPQSRAVPMGLGRLGNSTALNSVPVCGVDRRAVLGELRSLSRARPRPWPPRAPLCSSRGPGGPPCWAFTPTSRAFDVNSGAFKNSVVIRMNYFPTGQQQLEPPCP